MSEERRLRWDLRFLALAEHVAGWSKDPSTKVGAVLADERMIVLGLGYNGFPRGISDDLSRYEDRELKYKLVVHAETNAVLNSYGSLLGSCLFSTEPPCYECSKLLIQSGITRVVSWAKSEEDEWWKRWDNCFSLFREAGVEVQMRVK